MKRYRYTGKENDKETGFYYYGARYYAPWLARWTSCDPSGLGDGSNYSAIAGTIPSPAWIDDGTQTQPLNPLGRVSWEIPSDIYSNSSGARLSDAETTANFEAWMAKAHPDRPFTPGQAPLTGPP